MLGVDRGAPLSEVWGCPQFYSPFSPGARGRLRFVAEPKGRLEAAIPILTTKPFSVIIHVRIKTFWSLAFRGAATTPTVWQHCRPEP